MAIINQKNTSFGGRTTDIVTDAFSCTLTTAKDGLFKGLSTLIWLPEVGVTPVAKIKYSQTVSKDRRQKLHDEISVKIDSFGESGGDFAEALDSALFGPSESGEVAELTMSSDWT